MTVTWRGYRHCRAIPGQAITRDELFGQVCLSKFGGVRADYRGHQGVRSRIPHQQPVKSSEGRVEQGQHTDPDVATADTDTHRV